MIVGDRPEAAYHLQLLQTIADIVIDAQQCSPNVAPHEVAGGAPEVLRFAPGNGDARGREPAHDFGDEPRLAPARLCGDGYDAAAAGSHIVDGASEHLHLGIAPDHWQRVANLPFGGTASEADDRRDSHSVGLALDGEIADDVTLDAVVQGGVNLFADVHVAGRCLRHQACGEVHRVSQTGEGAPERMTVRTAAYAAVGDADLQLRRRRVAFQRQQFECCRRRPRRVVFVGMRCAEHRAEVGALVAEDHVQEVAAVFGQDPLRAPNEVVELAGRIGIVVVVDATEAEEQGIRRAELC